MLGVPVIAATIGVMSSLPWPIQGAIDFARNPRWWGWPLFASILIMALCVAVGIGLIMGLRPGPNLEGWRVLLRWLIAIGSGLVGMVATWFVMLPVIIALAFERVVLQVQRDAGAPAVPAESFLGGLWSALHIVIKTLPMRAAAIAATFVGTLFGGPIGLIIAAIMISYIALFDACDLALAVRGVPGNARIAIIHAHRNELRRLVLPCAGWHMLLMLLIVGWLIWLPGIIIGAARAVLRWPELTQWQAQQSADTTLPASR